MQAPALIRAVLASSCVAAALPAFAQSNAQALADRWAQAYNKHDRAALGAVYSEDARLILHNTGTVSGRRDIEDYWARDFADRNPITVLTVTHAVRGSDMTLVHGDYQVIIRESGRQLSGGRFAHIWTLGAGREWQLDRDLWSDAFEPYASSERTESAVQALADRWTEAYNRHDRAALAALYADDARLMMHGAPTIGGADDIGLFWAQDFTAGNPLTVLTVTHALEGVDTILVHGNYEVIDRVDGSKVGLGRFAHIWTGGDGEWRLDRDLWYERSEAAP